MTAKTSGASPSKRCKYQEVFKAAVLRLAGESRSTQAAARQLGISPKLLYRWQQMQFVAEVGSVAVARDLEVQALHVANKRLAQEIEIIKKPWSSSTSWPRVHLLLHRLMDQPNICAPAIPGAVRIYYAWQRRQQAPPAEPVRQVDVSAAFSWRSQRYGTR